LKSPICFWFAFSYAIGFWVMLAKINHKYRFKDREIMK
jgi:hypothetical protein